MKFVISLVDVGDNNVIDTKEIPFNEGEDATKLEFRLRDELIRWVTEDDKGAILPALTPARSREKTEKRVTNASLQKTVEAHEDVIQSLIRTLHSKGMMTEVTMKRLVEVLGGS